MKSILINCTTNQYSSRTLGTYRIATVLRENNWDAEVIDFFLFWPEYNLKKYLQSIITTETKFIGFGFLFPDISYETRLNNLLIWIKEKYPNIVIITGSAINLPFKNNLIDYHIRGFGELAVLELLKYLFSNGTRPNFSLSTSLSSRTKVIDAIHFYPAFPLQSLMVKYHDNDFLEPDEWSGIEFARGCIFQCDFCNFPVLGVKGDYTRSAEDLRLQLQDTYDRFGVSNYSVADETFNDRTDKIIKFADVIEKLPFETNFTGFMKPELLVTRPGDREHLLRMNFIGHYYGIESFVMEARKAVSKGMDAERVKESLIETKRYFENNGKKHFRGTLSFIVGLPGETEETLKESKSWLIKNWQKNNAIFFALHINKGNFGVKKSKIDNNYESYGYTEMSEEEINLNTKKYLIDYNFENYGTSFEIKDRVYWKNNHMNMIQALNMCYSLEPDLCQKGLHHIGAYDLGALGVNGNVEHRLNVEENLNEFPIKEEILMQRVRRYITKKFNYLAMV